MTTLIHPMLAANAFQFAIEKATPEGKTTIGVLLLLSLFSWTIIITKFRQLYIARRGGEEVFRRLQRDARSAGHQEARRGV